MEHLHLHGLLCAKLSQIHSVPADSANRSKWQVLYSLAYNATSEHAVPVCCATACLRALHTCTAALALYIGVARKNICLIHGPVRLCATELLMPRSWPWSWRSLSHVVAPVAVTCPRGTLSHVPAASCHMSPQRLVMWQCGMLPLFPFQSCLLKIPYKKFPIM